MIAIWTLLLALAATCATVLSYSTEGTPQLVLRGLAAIFGSGVAVCAFLKVLHDGEEKRSKAATELEARLAQETKDAEIRSEITKRKDTIQKLFGPLWMKISRMAGSDGQERARSQVSGVVTSALGIASTLLDAKDSRIVYFRLDEIDVLATREAATRRIGARILTPSDEMPGEHAAVRRQFRSDDRRDGGVWHVLETGEIAQSGDVELYREKGFDASRKRTYRSFVTVAARADDVQFGVLTASNAKQDAFSPSDVVTLELLATSIATAEAVALGSEWRRRIRSFQTERAASREKARGARGRTMTRGTRLKA